MAFYYQIAVSPNQGDRLIKQDYLNRLELVDLKRKSCKDWTPSKTGLNSELIF
jgi:hypothetical protein